MISAEATGSYVTSNYESSTHTYDIVTYKATISKTSTSITCGYSYLSSSGNHGSASYSDTCKYKAIFANTISGKQYIWEHSGAYSGTIQASGYYIETMEWEDENT